MDGSALLTNQQTDPIDVFHSSPPPSLPGYGFPIPRNSSSSPTGNSVPKGTKKRKLSSFADHAQSQDSDEDEQGEDNGLQRNGSARKSRSSGTKRACNQCRQQKVGFYYPAAVTRRFPF